MAMSKQLSDTTLEVLAPKLDAHVTKLEVSSLSQIPAQKLHSSAALKLDQPTNAFISDTEYALWAKKEFGEDFYHFYTKKIQHKSNKINSLKMDFYLSPTFKVKSKSNKSDDKYVEIGDAPIEALTIPEPETQFSDIGYEWNPANLTIVKISDDYQKFVDDEILAGQTYKEFWDGEETTEFEDFIDDHFSFHDSALMRVLIMLSGCLIALLSYKKWVEFIEYIQSIF